MLQTPTATGVELKYRPGSPPPAETRATSERMGATIGRRLDDQRWSEWSASARSPSDSATRPLKLHSRGSCAEDNVAAPIVGASRPDQVRENAAAADIDLDAETNAEIEAVFA